MRVRRFGILDLVPVFVAIAVAPSRRYDIYALIEAILPLWVMIRVGPALLAVSGNVDARQEFALTDLPPDALLRLLVWPVLRNTIIPAAVAACIMAGTQILLAPTMNELDLVLTLTVGSIIFVTFVAVDALSRMLQPCIRSETRVVLMVVAVVVAAGTVPLLILAHAISGYPDPSIFMFGIPLVFVLLAPRLIVLRWRKCCELLYQFE